MSKYQSTYNAAQLIETLKASGYVSKDNDVKAILEKKYSHQELPLYLRIIAGLGAFFSSIFVTWFLFSAEILTTNDYNLLTGGIIFIAVAMGLKRCLDLMDSADDTLRASFIIQTSFAALAVGKTLFLIGGVNLTKDVFSLESGTIWPVPVLLLLLTMATYFTYRMSIDRFLSSLAVLVTTLFAILGDVVSELQSANLTGNSVINVDLIWFDVLFVFEVLIGGYLLSIRNLPHKYVPLAYAFVFAMFLNILFLNFRHVFQIEGLREDIVGNLALTGAFIALIFWLGRDRLSRELFIGAICGAILLGIISAAGIIFILVLLILGYAKHDRILLVLGTVTAPLFLWHYYYSLEITLMMKSGVLIASGLILLTGYFYLKRRGGSINA